MKPTPRYTNPYLMGAILGVVLWGSYLLAGRGLGASGGLQRIAAWALQQVNPTHVDETAQWAAIAGGSKNPLDHWLVWLVGGVALGGLVSGLIAKRVGLEVRRGPHVGPLLRLVLAFGGGALVGYAARLSRGCTSGQALSGGAVLSVGSWVFMLCVFAGAYLLASPLKRIWR